MQTPIKDFKRSIVRNAVRSAIAFTALSGLSINAAYAAEDDSENAKDDSEKIVVTGSRIRRDEFSSPSPIQILKVEDAKKAGITSVAEMLGRLTLTSGQQFDETFNSNSGNSNATEAPPPGGVGSTNVGLRSMGPERTLILVDGRRLGASGVRGAPSQPDINLIPFEMVDRIEVLSDSASAVYGADAVAGVINIILKSDYEGAQFSGSISSTADGGGDIKEFSFVTGSQSERSSFVFGAEFYDRERIALGDRIDCIKDFSKDANTGDIYSFCRLGFPDNAAIILTGDVDSPTGSVWSFYTPGSSDLTDLLNGGNIPNWSSAQGLPDAPTFPCYSTGAPCTLASQPNTGRFVVNPFYNDQDERLNSDLVQPSTRFSLVMKGDYQPEWGESMNANIYYQTMYFHRHLTNTPAMEQLFVIQPDMIPQDDGAGGLVRDSNGDVVLFDNPLNPWPGPVLNIVTFDQLNQTRDVNLDHFRAIAGIGGDFTGEWASQKGWYWDFYASYDKGEGQADQPLVNEDHLALSLETQRLSADGSEVICGYQIPLNEGQGFITPTECVPFDVWNARLYSDGEGTAGRLSDAEAAYLIGQRVNTTTVEQALYSASVGGELFNFPAGGAASIAIGAEARFDKISSRADMLSATGGNAAENPSTEGVTAGRRDVQEYFAEISMPILLGHEMAEELTVDLAARSTDESNFGSENTERVRVLYSPVDWITLSAAYGTSFRAPNLREQFLGDQFDGVSGGADPCNVNNAGDGWDGTTYTASLDERSADVLAYCNSVGVDPTVLGSAGTTTIPVRIGGNVFDLKPETSDQTTVTLKMAPVREADINFDFAITYFDIDIKNNITSLSPGKILSDCATGRNTDLCSRVIRPANPAVPAQAFPTAVDASFVNLGQEIAKGYDINTRFQMNFDELTVYWNTMWTRLSDKASRLEDEPLDDIVGDFGTPENRFLNTLSIVHGDFQYTLNSNYIDETKVANIEDISRCNTAAADSSIAGNPLTFDLCTAESQWVHDLSATWTPDDSLRITVGLRNLTNEEPPMVNTGLGSNRGGRIVSSGYDQFGRTYFANFTYKF